MIMMMMTMNEIFECLLEKLWNDPRALGPLLKSITSFKDCLKFGGIEKISGAQSPTTTRTRQTQGDGRAKPYP